MTSCADQILDACELQVPQRLIVRVQRWQVAREIGIAGRKQSLQHASVELLVGLLLGGEGALDPIKKRVRLVGYICNRIHILETSRLARLKLEIILKYVATEESLGRGIYALRRSRLRMLSDECQSAL